MSINQYSSDIPETPWWCTQQQQQQGILMEPLIQSASSCGPPIYPSWPTQTQLYHHHRQQQLMNRGFNLNQDELELEVEEEEELEEAAEEEEQGGSSSQSIYVENGRCWRSAGGGGGGEVEEKEAMFEKALTPSDVGKLNRLVIPKQQAEKYFPLSDSGDNKGVLLSFEDESAKCWRFRYSYWNSSQSYVLTKGWSRYVKDKRLHAGDVVSFHRLRSLPHRLFITWRRRHTAPSPGRAMAMAVGTHASTAGTATNTSNTKGVGVSVGWTTMPFYSAHPYPTHQTFPSPPQTDFHAPGRGSQSEKQITGNSCKVLRLFGVNMECQTEPDESGPSRPEYPIHMMSSSTHHDFYQYHHLHPSYAPNPHHHMDVNQMRNRPG